MAEQDQDKKPPEAPPATREAGASHLHNVFGAGPIRSVLLPPSKNISGCLPWDPASVTVIEKFGPGSVLSAACGGDDGVMALAFSSHKDAETFVNENPAFVGTLATGFCGLVLVWLRATGKVPPSRSLGEVAVFGDGFVPILPFDSSDTFCNIVWNGNIPTVDLLSLVCHGRLLDFVIDLNRRRDFGPPYLPKGKRKREINANYWAAAICQELGTRYYLTTGEYFILNANGIEKNDLPQETLIKIIGRYLNAARQRDPDFPPGELRLPRIKAVIQAIKAEWGYSDPDECTVFGDFISDSLERRPESTLTSAAIAEACQAYRKNRGLPRCSEKVMGQELNRLINQRLGVRQSNDIIEDGKARRGFHGLAFREKAPVSITQMPAMAENCYA